MTTLSDIEAATDALSVEQKERLLLFLAERLRAERATVPPPRHFGRAQLEDWIAEDQTDGDNFRKRR